MRVTCKEAHFQYPASSAPVFERLNLDICAGETVALVGPSGSGKTTLLSVLGGLLSVTGGSVTASRNGRPIPLATSCGWITQTTNALGSRTALDNAALGAYFAGAGNTWLNARSDAIVALRRLGLGSRLHSRSNTLSGGELQRVSIARALVSQKPIILADEPTGQLDQETTDRVMREIAESLSEASRILVVATHDEEVAAKCSRVLRVSMGMVSDIGPLR